MQINRRSGNTRPCGATGQRLRSVSLAFLRGYANHGANFTTDGLLVEFPPRNGYSARVKRTFLCLSVAMASLVQAADDPGFVPLFNGRDLTGWVNANCAPETWSVTNGLIHCIGKPTGGLRTVRQYENFILELEWRHLTRGGNSGIFIWATPIAAPGVPFLRGIEVQVLDHGYNAPGKNEWYTSHGDVFPIHGATMNPFGRHNGMRSFPSEERSRGTPEWNQYRIVCSNGTIRLAVNGKEVSGGENCNYRKGYLGLESEGAPVEFRNLRIKELKPDTAGGDVTAPLDLGWRPLFTGLDLRGWRTNAATASAWLVTNERLVRQAVPAAQDAILWTEAEFGDAEFIVDCRPQKDGALPAQTQAAAWIRSPGRAPFKLSLEGGGATQFQRFTITLKGNQATVKHEDQPARTWTLPTEVHFPWILGVDSSGPCEFMNLYVRRL